MKFKLSIPTSGVLAFGLILAFTRASIAGSDSIPAPNLSGTWKLNKELSEDPGRKMMEAMRERGGMGGRGGGMGGGGRGGGGGGRGGGMGGGGRRGGAGGGRGGGGGMEGGMRERGGAGGGFGMDEPPLDGNPDIDRPNRPQGSPDGGSDESAGGSAQEQRERGLRRGMRGLAPSPQFKIEQEGDNIVFRTDSNLRLLHSDGEKRKKEGSAGKQDVTARFVKGTLVIETKGEQGGKRRETYTLREDKKLEIDFEIDGSGRMPEVKFKLIYEAAPTLGV